MFSTIIASVIKTVPELEGQKLPQFSLSTFEDYDYQASLFFKIKDTALQDKIIEAFRSNSFFEKVEATARGGVRTHLSLKFNLAKVLMAQRQASEEANAKFVEEMDYAHLGKNYPGSETVLVDYCGVNVAKQMHIGHIRSMFIGDYVVNHLEKLGKNVVIQNHIGDWGNQFGYLLEYVMEQKVDVSDNKALTEAYKKAYEMYKDPEQAAFKEKADKRAIALQKKDSATLEVWQKCVDTSMSQAQEFFKLFNLQIGLEHTQGESFYAPLCQSVIDELISKGVVTKNSDGLVIAEFEKLPTCVLQKGNGNFLYGAYDLAAIKWRFENFKDLSRIVYVVDKRQALHFNQIFNLAVKAGWARPEQLVHLGFGTILGLDKRPLKTKSGDNLYLDDLVKEGLEKFASGPHYNSELDVFGVNTKSVIGALKYYDLHLSLEQDYVFDWAHVLNTKGNSAPYLQNAYVRIDSIIYKSSFANIDMQLGEEDIDVLNLEGKKLVFDCLALNDAISESYTNSAKICDSLTRIAQDFHAFYEKTKILGHTSEESYIKMLNFVANQLKSGGNLLGIEFYDCEAKLIAKKGITLNK